MQSIAPRSILIVLSGSLGDIARGLCLVDPLRAWAPEASISWLSDERWASIVRLHPRITRVIEFSRSRGMRGVVSLARQLRREQFDLTLDLQRHLKSGVFSFLSGASRRVGFHPRDAKEFNWIFNTEYIGEGGEEIPKIDHYLKFLEHLGVNRPERLSFGLGEYSVEQLAPRWALERPARYVAIILGSSWRSKDWPASGYQQLVERILAGSRHAVVLLGDRTVEETANRLRQSSSSAERVVSLAGRTSLVELLGILRGADACVGPDSGPGHLAAALGVRQVTLFGPTLASRTAPAGSQDLVVSVPLGCAPCYRRVCPGLNTVCMRMIAPDVVFDMLRPLIQGVV